MRASRPLLAIAPGKQPFAEGSSLGCLQPPYGTTAPPGLTDLGGTTNVTLLGFGPDFRSRQVTKIGPLRSLVWMEDYHQTTLTRQNSGTGSGCEFRLPGRVQGRFAAHWLNRSTRHFSAKARGESDYSSSWPLCCSSSTLDSTVPYWSRQTLKLPRLATLLLRITSSMLSPVQGRLGNT